MSAVGVVIGDLFLRLWFQIRFEFQVEKWRGAVEENLQECRRSLRMLVTAPKVSINVGGNEFAVQSTFPFELIKTAIRDSIIPKWDIVPKCPSEVHSSK